VPGVVPHGFDPLWRRWFIRNKRRLGLCLDGGDCVAIITVFHDVIRA
jgi:hypothetical protein